MASALKTLSALGMTLCLAGCQSIPTIPIAATETPAQVEARLAAKTCKAWPVVTYSSRDTEQTQLEVRGSNAAREAYCK